MVEMSTFFEGSRLFEIQSNNLSTTITVGANRLVKYNFYNFYNFEFNFELLRV